MKKSNYRIITIPLNARGKDMERSSSRISIQKFREAQKTEQEYWQQNRDKLVSGEHNRNKQCAAEGIFTELKAATDDGRKEKVLEVGGGGDPMIIYFHGEKGMVIDPLARFYKLELLPGQLSSVVYFNGIGENLPFRDGSFDGVLLYNCIDHGLAPFDIISESGRVLRKGGAVHVLVNTYSSNYIIFRRLIEQIIPTYSVVDHTHYLRFNTIRKHLVDSGFTEVSSFHDENPYSKVLGNTGDSERNFIINLIKGHRVVRAFYRLERK